MASALVSKNRKEKNFFLFSIIVAVSSIVGFAWGDTSGYALQLLPFCLTVVFAIVAKSTFLKNADAQRKLKWDASIAMMLVPLSFVVFAYIVAPGFTTPWFRHPIAKMVYIVLLLWTLSGSILMFSANTRLKKLSIVILFALPLMLTPFMGPAVVTFYLSQQPQKSP